MKLEHKDAFERSLEQLASSELESMVSKISKELERRRRAEKEQAWEEVKRAVLQYIKKYGSITISSNYGDEIYAYADSPTSFEDIGTISVKL